MRLSYTTCLALPLHTPLPRGIWIGSHDSLLATRCQQHLRSLAQHQNITWIPLDPDQLGIQGVHNALHHPQLFATRYVQALRFPTPPRKPLDTMLLTALQTAHPEHTLLIQVDTWEPKDLHTPLLTHLARHGWLLPIPRVTPQATPDTVFPLVETIRKGHRAETHRLFSAFQAQNTPIPLLIWASLQVIEKAPPHLTPPRCERALSHLHVVDLACKRGDLAIAWQLIHWILLDLCGQADQRSSHATSTYAAHALT